jgi:ribosome biogenesis GTPase
VREKQLELGELGWNSSFVRAFAEFEEQGCVPARVAVQHKGRYLLYAEDGELRGEVTGRMLYHAGAPGDLPAVGDWVVARLRPGERVASILGVLPRTTAFARRSAGGGDERQILAANMDVAFLVNALDSRFTPRRTERYLVVSRDSGARPVILLNKADLCEEAEEIAAEVRALAPEVAVHVLSAKQRTGIDAVRSYLARGVTAVLLGPSGAGKSTIINVLIGMDIQPTGDVRDVDDRGRHTTARRELVLLPENGLLIDTPGLRELQLPDMPEDVSESFQDIEEIAASCRFRDCRHEEEPGCAVRKAVQDGDLDESRLGSFRKLQREQEYQRRRYDRLAQQEHKEKWKKITAKHKRGYRH